MPATRMTLDQFQRAADEAGVVLEATPIASDTSGKFAQYSLQILGEGGYVEINAYGRHGAAFIDAEVAQKAIKAASEAPARTRATDQAVIGSGQPTSEQVLNA